MVSRAGASRRSVRLKSLQRPIPDACVVNERNAWPTGDRESTVRAVPGPEPDAHAHSPQARWFTTTHWSVVLAAGDDSSASGAAALEQLCHAYWYPLYAYVRRKGYGPEDAQDLTQGFLARLLAGNRIARADPARGRFRTFLLSALQNFLINEWAKLAREKRGGNVEFVALHSEDPERLYAAEPADDRTPELIYEQRWAAAVMARAFDRLGAEYKAGQAQLFEALKPFVWGEKSGASHAEIGAVLGLSGGAVRVAVHRLRRRYRNLLREEIAQTVSSAAEIDDELRHLIHVVSQGPV
jgi:RNA polymerase sigma factor (sigma-70 family)